MFKRMSRKEHRKRRNEKKEPSRRIDCHNSPRKKTRARVKKGIDDDDEG